MAGNTIDGLWDGVPWDGNLAHTPSSADDGIILYDEANDVVQSNAIKNVWDAGIEGIGTVSNTLIDNNTFENMPIGGVTAYYNTIWRGNTISRNTASRTPSLFYFENVVRGNVTTGFAFADNRFVNNRFIRTPGGQGSAMTMNFGQEVTVTNNFLQGNDFGDSVYSLSPASGFIDGGGNICRTWQVAPIRCN